jgi:hypothetical protein
MIFTVLPLYVSVIEYANIFLSRCQLQLFNFMLTDFIIIDPRFKKAFQLPLISPQFQISKTIPH